MMRFPVDPLSPIANNLKSLRGKQLMKICQRYMIYAMPVFVFLCYPIFAFINSSKFGLPTGQKSIQRAQLTQFPLSGS